MMAGPIGYVGKSRGRPGLRKIRKGEMAQAKKGFLDGAYKVEDPDATKSLYRDWAATYEEEVRNNGYVTPTRCATALAAMAEDPSAALLDLGCGTGLSGEALQAAGFTTLDGSDFSEDMLAFARKKGLYRNLVKGDLNNPLPARKGDYRYIAAIGVFSPGHAPAAMIADVMAVLPKGGLFVFSMNDHAMEDPSYEAEIERLIAAGTAEMAFKEYGEHLPGRGIKAFVIILQKL